jgi:phosphoglycerate kinase
MAYTFLRAQGHGTGKSLVEEDQLPLAMELLQVAAERKVPLLLPTDHVVAEKAEEGVPVTTVHDEIPPGKSGFDIGPETTNAFSKEIAKGRTIFWNGPVGLFEGSYDNRGR